MGEKLTAFRQGDVRGVYPSEISEQFVERFAHAFVGHFKLAGKIVTGRDMRSSSLSLQNRLNETFSAIGIQVVDIGLCPTELGDFASSEPAIDAAIIVTASHNPSNYNGLKSVLSGGQAVVYDTGLLDLQLLMASDYRHPIARGSISEIDYRGRYLEFIRSHFLPDELYLGNLALNGLNGTASTVADLISSDFELPVTWFRKVPGPIPKEGADPGNSILAEEMRGFMEESGFSVGFAWDGDCDRFVCFDGAGDLIPPYYIVGLFTEHFLKQSPGAAIVFDTKLCWNTLELIERGKGRAIPSKTGHAFVKQKMHQYSAVYGGEISSHHYFGDFFGCDSGMFAWLTMLKILEKKGEPVESLIEERRSKICCTPEITVSIFDAEFAFTSMLEAFSPQALKIDYFDGLSFEMPGDWRFSVQKSKTEPVIRINFEARRTAEILLEEGLKVFEVLEVFRADESDWLANFRTY